jgi:hypothetical protein
LVFHLCMTWLSTVVATAVESRPAGAAPLGEVIIATGVIGGLSAALGLLAFAHRTERTRVLDRLMARAETSKPLGGLAGWASIPLMVAMLSLITALLGMYWDIALHIGVGRDEGPLANPAHYPIMFGLFGVSAAGVLACVLPRTTEPGPASVSVTRRWHAPVGGVLLTGAGSYALLGFPLDDVWHRIFGQDVTLWGPTHLMLIGGAGLSLVAMAILYEEGRRAASSGATDLTHTVRDYVLKSCAMGGMLIGLSVFQAEFDFGVPQFRLVLQPLLIATAAALTLTVARLWIGRGGAVAAVVFYLLVRGGVSVVVGPVLGELWASVPLYVVEALCVEVVALFLAHRAGLTGTVLFGAVSGLLVGTVGYASEFAWTQVAYPLPWTSDMAVEGMLMSIVGGVAGGVCGGLLALGLAGRLPTGAAPRTLFVASLIAVTAAVANGLVISTPSGLTATLQEVEPVETSGGQAVEAEIRFNRPPTDGELTWVQVTAWQGGSSGLHIDHLERVDDVTYRTTEPMPVEGTWKTLVRVHDGRTLAAAPLYLPEDTALDEPEVPATAGDPREVGEEKEILQRELKDDVPGWVWVVAGLVVLLCSLVLVTALGWGTSRYSRLRQRATSSGTPARERV